MQLFNYLLIIFVSLSFALLSQSGKVVKVKDGDTFEMLIGGSPTPVRLDHIDCPEKEQDYGAVAKKFLSDLIFGKTVSITSTGALTYDRVVADVYLEDGTWVNLKIVQAGLAWWYKKYSSNRDIQTAEATARRNKIGLWKEPNPIPPWEYRNDKNTNDKTKKVKRQCIATTKKGSRCKKNAVEGSDYCSTHKRK